MILPNKSPANQSAARVSAIMSALEEALLSSPGWMTLTDFERRSVRYYVKEYAVGNVDTDTLVLTLTELLDSSEKVRDIRSFFLHQFLHQFTRFLTSFLFMLTNSDDVFIY